ncbi:MAG: ankyrin repeat domain-containing protein [Myxococcota bacterium]
MVSKTRMLERVKNFQWKEIESGLADSPELMGFRDERGRNWLHLCCSVDPSKRTRGGPHSIRTADVLLEAGFDLNEEAFREDLGAIELLVDAGAEIDALVEDETPFLSAAKTSHFRAAKLLLDLGADIDFKDPAGMTALHYMLKKNSDEKHFKVLLGYGPRGDISGPDGRTAADMMARKRGPGFRRMAAQLAEA